MVHSDDSVQEAVRRVKARCGLEATLMSVTRTRIAAMNTVEIDDQDRKFEEESHAHGGKVRVTVTYVNTSATVDFRMPRKATLKETFAQAYDELKEKPRPEDRYLCEDGHDLAPHLGLTLEELHKRKICRKRRFEIAGPTGGA